MKRIIAAVALLVFLGCQAASAEFDYVPYQLGQNHWPSRLGIWNETDYVIAEGTSSSGGLYHDLCTLIWYRNRSVYRTITVQLSQAENGKLKSTCIPVPRPDGTCAVLYLHKETPDSLYQVGLYDWNEGGLENMTAITDRAVTQPYRFAAGTMTAQRYFALLEDHQGCTELCVYDVYGDFRQRIALPQAAGHQMLRCAFSDDGSRIVLTLDHDDADYKTVYIQEGKVIWEKSGKIIYNGVVFDARFGFYGTYYEEESAKIVIEHFRAQGESLWRRKLSGDRIVFTASGLRMAPGNQLIVSGIAQAHSRHLYRMFRMTLDESGSMTGLDVRDCDYHENYTLFSLALPDTELFYGVASGYPAALVAFERLPAADNPGIKVGE